jgi:transcriptional regulator
MYQPRQFQEARAEPLHALMRAHPMALLMVSTDAGIEANPLPLHLIVGEGGAPSRLVGHVARANPVWHMAARGEALAVFTAAQGYVSPGWYPSKAEHGKAVPTWNYATVHAHGCLRFVDDAAWVRAQLEQLTHAHEAQQAQPWHLHDAPEDYLHRMIGAVVGLELSVTRLEGKFKLSQNRSEADRQGVIEGLGTQGEAQAQELAEAMQAWQRPAESGH